MCQCCCCCAYAPPSAKPLRARAVGVIAIQSSGVEGVIEDLGDRRGAPRIGGDGGVRGQADVVKLSVREQRSRVAGKAARPADEELRALTRFVRQQGEAFEIP